MVRRYNLTDNLLVGLDLGTTQVRVVIGELNDAGILEIRGIGVAPSTGLRKGVIVNIEATIQAIVEAVDKAELMAGREVREVICGVSGANVESINQRGNVAVESQDREISAKDIDRVIETAQAIKLPMDREILHVIPQTYSVDEQKAIEDPLDMIGVRLEAEVHIITTSITTKQNLIKCIERADIKPERLILQSLASAEATLSQEEKELGCLHLDVGGGATNLLAFCDGAPYYTSVLPLGGITVTSDISMVLNIPLDVAEKLKIDSGAAISAAVESDEMIIIPGLGGRSPIEAPRKDLCDIIEPRVEEIFSIARTRIEEKGLLSKLKGGIVITGGGALLPGITLLAERIFELPARIGNPTTIGGLLEDYRKSEFSTVIGLVMIVANEITQSEVSVTSDVNKSKRGSGRQFSESKQKGVFGSFVNWIRETFF